MTSPVMRNHAVAKLSEVEHLPVPVVSAQWPTVRKNDRLSVAPVFVKDLCAVFGCDGAHI
jgi:hypothetical protein